MIALSANLELTTRAKAAPPVPPSSRAADRDDHSESSRSRIKEIWLWFSSARSWVTPTIADRGSKRSGYGRRHPTSGGRKPAGCGCPHSSATAHRRWEEEPPLEARERATPRGCSPFPFCSRSLPRLFQGQAVDDRLEKRLQPGELLGVHLGRELRLESSAPDPDGVGNDRAL